MRNIISANQLDGIDIDGLGTTGILVAGNYLGTGQLGLTSIGNAGNGVEVIDADHVTISGNVASGNSSAGVAISGSGATNNLVVGNFIGVGSDGKTPVANGLGVLLADDGVNPGTGANNNTIGGTNASVTANVISGNDLNGSGFGVEIIGASTSANVVLGNRIGTDSTGTLAVPNAFGIGISSATGNTIGGSASGSGNLISGNDNTGILVDGGVNNVIAGNFIGTNASGTASFGTGTNTSGVSLSNAAIGNTIGGLTTGSANVISGTNGVGLSIHGSDSGFAPFSTANVVVGNFIGTDVTGHIRGTQPADIGVDLALAPSATQSAERSREPKCHFRQSRRWCCRKWSEHHGRRLGWQLHRHGLHRDERAWKCEPRNLPCRLDGHHGGRRDIGGGQLDFGQRR